MTSWIHAHTFHLCIRGSWCVCVIWVYVSDRGPHVAVGRQYFWRNWLALHRLAMEIVQLTLCKAEEQPCFLQAASHWSFIGSDHERPSNEEQEAGGDLGDRAGWKRGRQSGCKEKGEYQGESLYSWASVSLVYTCSNYVVKIFVVFWVFFWKLCCFYATDVFPLLSGKTTPASFQSRWMKQANRQTFPSRGSGITRSFPMLC